MTAKFQMFQLEGVSDLNMFFIVKEHESRVFYSVYKTYYWHLAGYPALLGSMYSFCTYSLQFFYSTPSDHQMFFFFN